MEVRDQVRFKRKLSNGSEILMGTIVRFTDDTKKVAIVSVQHDPRKPRTLMASARKEIPVEQLEPVKGAFGSRVVIHANPVHRSLGSLISNLNNR